MEEWEWGLLMDSCCGSEEGGKDGIPEAGMESAECGRPINDLKLGSGQRLTMQGRRRGIVAGQWEGELRQGRGSSGAQDGELIGTRRGSYLSRAHDESDTPKQTLECGCLPGAVRATTCNKSPLPTLIVAPAEGRSGEQLGQPKAALHRPQI